MFKDTVSTNRLSYQFIYSTLVVFLYPLILNAILLVLDHINSTKVDPDSINPLVSYLTLYSTSIDDGFRSFKSFVEFNMGYTIPILTAIVMVRFLIFSDKAMAFVVWLVGTILNTILYAAIYFLENKSQLSDFEEAITVIGFILTPIITTFLILKLIIPTIFIIIALKEKNDAIRTVVFVTLGAITYIVLHLSLFMRFIR